MIKQIVAILIFFVGFKSLGQNKGILKNTQIYTDDVQEVITFLASDNIKGRDTGSEGINQAASYIENKLISYGIEPYYDTYHDYFKVNQFEAYNVVGYLKGRDPSLSNEVVLIGAHYDHIGLRARKVGNDSIGNGANDNASGTATVLAMAKYFGANKNNKRSIIFVLFSAEEMGLRGSRHLAQRLENEKLNLYTMINFEMMGVPFVNRDYEVFVTGHDLSNMAEILNKYAGYKLVGKSDQAAKFSLFKRSDNYAFYQEFKIAAQTISSCDLTNFDYYHHVDDESDKIDYHHMVKTINKLFPVMEGMINAELQEIKMYNE